MTTRSIIDIEVNDEQFKAFHSLFLQYEDKLKSLAGEWEKAGASTKEAGIPFEKVVNDSQKIVDHTIRLTHELKKATKAQNEFYFSTNNAGKKLKKMAGDAKELGSSIFGIGKFLGKMGLYGFGLGGLGIFGLDALAHSAVNNQRKAKGIGVDQGSLRAFGTDFGRYVDPSMLSTIAAAQGDLTKRQYLSMAAGISYNQAGTMGADELAIKSMQNLHDWWAMTKPENRSTNLMSSRGFTQMGYSFEDARRIGTTSGADLLAASTQYRSDKKLLEVTDDVTSKWYILSRQLELAGQSIETNLINRLSDLGPAVGGLVTQLANDLKSIISGITPEDIDNFAKGIQTFSQYLGSKEFIDSLKTFGSAMFVLSGVIVKLASFFGYKAAKDTLGSPASQGLGVGQYSVQKASGSPKEHLARLSELDKQYGFPEGTMKRLWGAESDYGLDPSSKIENKKGALGDFQFLSKTAKDYGITDRSNFDQSSKGAAKYLSDLKKRYKGDLNKALAGYNWGLGRMDANLQNNGQNWFMNTPSSTQAYVNKVNGVNVVISNKTGSDVSVSTNALAH